MSRGLRSGVSLLLVVGLVAMTGLEARAQAPKKGGVLKVAVLGDPPTLDSHWTTANFVEIITQHIYESLYTLDQNYQDRKSTRLNSSHTVISYAVFCLKKKTS